MLSGEEIIKLVDKGEIIIKPYNKENVNPNSYNLTLNNKLMFYISDVLDVQKENKIMTIDIPDEGYVLSPNVLYLVESNEYTENKNFISQISGRSSIGRLGHSVHLCADGGLSGHKGKWLFQITCLLPIRIYKGMQIGQIYYFPIYNEERHKL